MFHLHAHHDHDHGHHHHHHGDATPDAGRRWPFLLRLLLGACLLGAAGLAATAVMVSAGQAVVITSFGDPVRVATHPGLTWKLPAPIQTVVPVDLRLRTTSTGLQDVGTRDGLRILVQAYIAWQVPSDPDRIRQFLRAVRNDPDEAARQLRTLVGSALQVTASNFDLTALVNADPTRVQLPAFEDGLRTRISQPVLDMYGIAVRQVGVERLSLPETALAATVGRMASERETVAAERTAEGLRAAAQIRSDAARDARVTVAHARTEAASIEAASRKEPADINAGAYAADPGLYLLLRSLDTLTTVVGANTRLVLRTDAAPFNMLVQAPQTVESLGAPPPVSPPPGSPPSVPPAFHSPTVPEPNKQVGDGAPSAHGTILALPHLGHRSEAGTAGNATSSSTLDSRPVRPGDDAPASSSP